MGPEEEPHKDRARCVVSRWTDVVYLARGAWQYDVRETA